MATCSNPVPNYSSKKIIKEIFRSEYLPVSATHGKQATSSQTSCVSSNVIGNVGHVRTNAPRGIEHGSPILDLHARHRIGIVRTPDLWTVAKHSSIKSPACYGISIFLEQDTHYIPPEAQFSNSKEGNSLRRRAIFHVSYGRKREKHQNLEVRKDRGHIGEMFHPDTLQPALFAD